MTSDRVYPLRVAVSFTGLTARQIRYYEAQGLIHPKRSGGKQRLYSQEDIDRLKLIKRLLAQGLTLGGISEQLRLDAAADEARDEGAFSEDRTDLKSLYPVSNRALLERFMDEKSREDE